MSVARPTLVEQRIEAIIDAAIDVSPRVTGRDVYVPLALLYDAVALIHHLREDSLTTRTTTKGEDHV